jgi:hypothetical protein
VSGEDEAVAAISGDSAVTSDSELKRGIDRKAGNR